MDFVISHFPAIFGVACFVALAAVGWWYLMDLNARLKRKRAEARFREAAERRREERDQ